MAAAAKPVFISYARTASRKHAVALSNELGRDAFLDTSDISEGEEFPPRLADAVLGARVVVIFATAAYFESRYCRAERLLALAPRGEPRHIVVAMAGGTGPDVTTNMGALAGVSWPAAADSANIAKLVRKRLKEVARTVAETDPATTAAVREKVLQGLILPLPASFDGIPAGPQPLPASIYDLFVGRESEMEQLHHLLRKYGSLALSGALQGGAGFGKTRLAIEYLHRYGPVHYRGGLFWMNAESTALEMVFHGMLSAIHRAAGEKTPGFDHYEKRAAANRRTPEQEIAAELGLELAGLKGGVLFVADNVPEPAPEQPPAPLSKWCPAHGQVTLLATSRAQLAGTSSLPVAEMTPEAAHELLTRELDAALYGSIARKEWGEIAEWTGRHALALDILNRSLGPHGRTPREMLEMARGKAALPALDRLHRALRASIPNYDLRGATEALLISYNLLSPPVQRAARLLARLAPEPIPLVLLKALVSEDEQDEVRAQLHRRHWVTTSPGDAPGMFGRVHRLLAEFLRAASGDHTEDLAELNTVCKALVKVLKPDACRDPRRWAELNPCLPHADHVFGLAAAEPDFPAPSSVVDLGLYTGILRWAQGLFAAARSTGERTLSLAKQRMGTDHPDTLTSMSNLASMIRAHGDLAGARKLQEEELTVCRRVLGAEHPDTLTSMSNLASTMHAQGDLAEARKLHEDVLAVRRRVLGAEHPDTPISVKNLVATMRPLGDLAAARTLLERALALRRDRPAAHPRQPRSPAVNATEALDQLGDHEAARAVLERDLLWLLDRDPATLGADQRKIREYVAAKVSKR